LVKGAVDLNDNEQYLLLSPSKTQG